MARYIIEEAITMSSDSSKIIELPGKVHFTDSSRKALAIARRMLKTTVSLVLITDEEKGIILDATLVNGKIRLGKKVHVGALIDKVLYNLTEVRLLTGDRPEGTTKEDLRRVIEKRDRFANEAVEDISRAARSFGVELEVEEELREL